MNIYRIISLVAAGFMLTAIFTLVPSASAQPGHGWGWTNSPERCVALATPEEPIEVWRCSQPSGTDSTDTTANDPTYQHNGVYTDVLYFGNLAHSNYNTGRVVTNRPQRHEGEYLSSMLLGGRFWPGWHPDGRHIDVLLEYRPEGETQWQYLWSNSELDPNDFEGRIWYLFDFTDRIPAHVNFDCRVSFHDPHEFNHTFRVNASRIEDYQNMAVVSNEDSPPGLSLNFSVYPNPTVGRVNFEGLTQPVVVEVYDLMGRMVRREDEVISRLDLSGLPSGVYVVGATTRDGASARQRVTIVR